MGPLIGAALVVAWSGMRSPDTVERAYPPAAFSEHREAQLARPGTAVRHWPTAGEQRLSRSARRVTSDASRVSAILGLPHPDVGQRLDAVIELANRGGSDATAALVAAAQGDTDAAVREEAVSALGEIDSEISRDALAHALTDADVSVRRAAVEALADLGGQASALSLKRALHDREVSVRAEAVDALGGIGGSESIALLRQAARDEAGVVREAAGEYLAELDDRR